MAAQCFKVIKRVKEEGFLPYKVNYGIVSEDALNRILDNAEEHEKVEFKEVQ